jgi:Transcriptional regulator
MSPRNEEQNQQIRDERRADILQAALKVFARKGLAGTKINDIADAAELSHGLIYHYFNSKDEIFTELVERAFDTSIGIFVYAAEAGGDPWERLTMMSETILSGAFEAESPYYFLMIIQAYTSEAVPQAVKDLAKEKESLYLQYLVSLLIEGQKAGQVAAGDPELMAVSYVSLIQGLAITKMQSGDAMAIPSADILLRLFRNPEAPVTIKAGNSPRDTIKFGPIQFGREWLVYQSQANPAAKPDILRTQIVANKLADTAIYQIVERTAAKGEETVIQVRSQDWQPVSIRIFDKGGQQTYAIDYQDGMATFDIPARKLHKTLKLKDVYYDIHTISYLFQAYPFEHQAKIQFNLVMDGRGGSPVGAFAMVVMETGREEVRVPAGNFDCYRLEMGIAGMAGVFAAKYKYNFWYSAAMPHILVKYQDQQGGSSLLTGKE